MKANRIDVEKLVSKESKDAFHNHLLIILLRDYEVQGEGLRDWVILWKSSIWIGPLYPVFTFYFNAKNQCVELEDKLNSGAKALLVLFGIFISYLLIFRVPLEYYKNLSPWLVLIVLLYGSAFFWFFRKVYLYEKENQLEDMLRFLGVEPEERKTKNEWPIKKIFFRLFSYPFCLFLIGLSLHAIITSDEYTFGIGAITICATYLISDLLMIYRKKKRK